MSKKNKDRSFEDSISRWTLFFHDPKYETDFRRTQLEHRNLTVLFKVVVYYSIISMIVYQMLTMVSVLFSLNFIIGLNPVAEVTLFLYLTLSFLIELYLRWKNLCPLIQGFFIYTAYPIVIVSTAFFAHGGPIFYIRYC